MQTRNFFCYYNVCLKIGLFCLFLVRRDISFPNRLLLFSLCSLCGSWPLSDDKSDGVTGPDSKIDRISKLIESRLISFSEILCDSLLRGGCGWLPDLELRACWKLLPRRYDRSCPDPSSSWSWSHFTAASWHRTENKRPAFPLTFTLTFWLGSANNLVLIIEEPVQLYIFELHL